jgi:hypothetical protein
VTALWQCAVCETINHGSRSCAACGASLTRRSAAATAVRSRLVPLPPPPPAAAPLSEPVRRAINREPINEPEWPYDEASFNWMPWPPEGHRPSAHSNHSRSGIGASPTLLDPPQLAHARHEPSLVTAALSARCVATAVARIHLA